MLSGKTPHLPCNCAIQPFLLAIIAAVVNHFINDKPIILTGLLTIKEFPNFSLLIFFIYNLVFFGFGEEVGWRGFVLPRFQNKMNALTASIALTIFWALWHLPLFFYRSGYTTMDIAGVFGWENSRTLAMVFKLIP